MPDGLEKDEEAEEVVQLELEARCLRFGMGTADEDMVLQVLVCCLMDGVLGAGKIERSMYRNTWDVHQG